MNKHRNLDVLAIVMGVGLLIHGTRLLFGIDPFSGEGICRALSCKFPLFIDYLTQGVIPAEVVSGLVVIILGTFSTVLGMFCFKNRDSSITE